MTKKTLLMIFLAFVTTSLFSQSDEKVLIFEMRDQIAPPMWHKMQKAFKMAEEEDVSLIVLDMNTYGGLVETADSMRTRILHSRIPVYVFINNNAASAGALISIACDSIYMVSGSSIGAATVVDQAGDAASEKNQAYMRSMMRATAKAKGRDPQIAQAMVDATVSVPGLIDSTKVLAMTVAEAIQWGFCEGEAENIDDVIAKSGIEDPQIIKPKYSWIDYLIGFLVNPIVSGLLIMVIIGGIYFELQSPGVGFPLIAAITAAVLYFAPLYLEGLASHWEIALFILGVILLLIEIFAIPGFGVAGVTGIIFVVAGLTLSLVDFVNISGAGIGSAFSVIIKAFGLVVFSATIGLFGSVFLAKKLLGDSKTFSRIALQSTQDSAQGFTVATPEYRSMEGKEGLAFSDLRPSGKVDIDGEIFDAQAMTGFIKKGDKVRAVHYEVGVLYVNKIAEKMKNVKDRIEIIQGDITKLAVDAIVNAANVNLSDGGGVNGAIHRAAGEKLDEACAQLGYCKTGQAKLTEGFDLPAKYIIHAVAPVWHGGLKDEPELLEQCYINSLQIALDHGFKTIVFPNLGTGIFMYPKDKAAEIAIDAVVRWLEKNDLPEKVAFCCFEEENYALYKKLLG